MPIYEYACGKCDHEFEVEQRIVDDPIKTCPSCRSRKVKRLISRTSFVLKGGGWYADAYSSSSGKKPPSSDGESKSASNSGADSKSDTKTDSKADSKPSKSDTAKSSGSGKSKDAA